MHSIGIGLPIPTLRTSIAFVNDGFVRPLISEVMHRMSSTKQVWLSEFGGEEKQREIDRLFEGDTKFLFLSFDRNTGAPFSLPLPNRSPAASTSTCSAH